MNEKDVIVEKKKGNNFFKRIAIAITNPKKYNELSKEKVGKTIWTFILISIIETIILCSMLAFFGIEISKIINTKIQEIPNFTISNQGFTTENNLPFIYETEDNSFFVSIEPGNDLEELKNIHSEKIFSASNYLLVSNDKLVFRSSSGKDEFKFKDIPEGEIYTKDTLLNMYNNFINGTIFKIICAIICIAILTYLIVAKIVSGLIFALIAMIISNIQNKKIGFRRLFNIALYASVPIIIVGILQSVVVISIPYWPIIKITIICVYLWFGIKYCENDDNIEKKENNEIEEHEKIEEKDKEENKGE